MFTQKVSKALLLTLFIRCEITWTSKERRLAWVLLWSGHDGAGVRVPTARQGVFMIWIPHLYQRARRLSHQLAKIWGTKGMREGWGLKDICSQLSKNGVRFIITMKPILSISKPHLEGVFLISNSIQWSRYLFYHFHNDSKVSAIYLLSFDKGAFNYTSFFFLLCPLQHLLLIYWTGIL